MEEPAPTAPPAGLFTPTDWESVPAVPQKNDWKKVFHNQGAEKSEYANLSEVIREQKKVFNVVQKIARDVQSVRVDLERYAAKPAEKTPPIEALLSGGRWDLLELDGSSDRLSKDLAQLTLEREQRRLGTGPPMTKGSEWDLSQENHRKRRRS